MQFTDEYFKAEDRLLWIYLAPLSLPFLTLWFIILPDKKILMLHPIPVLLLSYYCCGETRIERKCSTIRDTSMSSSPKIYCRGTIHFPLKRRDIVARRESNRRTIFLFLTSSSALCRVLDWSNRTLVNGRNRFRHRSTTNSSR